MPLKFSLLSPFIKKHKITIANLILTAIVSALIGYIIGFNVDLTRYGWQSQYNGAAIEP